MPYITEGDLENFKLQDIDSSYAAWIVKVIAFVEDYIDKYCDTSFAGTAAGVVRYFDGSGEDEIYIGDFQTLTEVAILQADGNTEKVLTADTDYWKYPLNDTVKNTLKLASTGAYSRFPCRKRALKVTGTWGWGTSNVPNPIKLSAIKLASKIIDEGLRGGQVKAESLGSYRIGYREVDEVAEAMGVKDILDQYRPMLLE